LKTHFKIWKNDKFNLDS